MLWNSNTLCLMSHHMLMVSSPDILSAQMDTWYHVWSTRTIYTNITENNTWYFHLGDVNVEQREKSGMSFSRKRRSILLVCTTYNVYNAHIEYIHITFLVNDQQGKNILLVWWPSFPNHFSKTLDFSQLWVWKRAVHFLPRKVISFCRKRIKFVGFTKISNASLTYKSFKSQTFLEGSGHQKCINPSG